MKKLFLSLAAIFLASSAFAHPFSFSNFYLDGFGGFNFVTSKEEDDVRIDLNSGFAVGSTLGYRFSRFIRVEGEIAYRSNSFDQLVLKNTQEGDIQFPASGGIRKITGIGNILLDIPLLPNDLVPYCGFGVGKRWDRETFTLEPVHTTQGTYFFPKLRKRTDGIVFQGIFGLTFWRGKKTQTAAEYRYLDGPDIQGNHTLGLNLKRFF